MRMILLGAVALFFALAGCTPGMTDRAVVGTVNTPWADVNAMALTYNKMEEAALQGTVKGNGVMPDQTDIPSTLEIMPSGAMKMTGPGVVYHGLAAFCRVAVNSPICGANPPDEFFASLP